MDTDLLVKVAEHGGALAVIGIFVLAWVRARVKDGKITVCVGSTTSKAVEQRAIKAEAALAKATACLECEREEKDESQREFISWLKAEKSRRTEVEESRNT